MKKILICSFVSLTACLGMQGQDFSLDDLLSASEVTPESSDASLTSLMDASTASPVDALVLPEANSMDDLLSSMPDTPNSPEIVMAPEVDLITPSVSPPLDMGDLLSGMDMAPTGNTVSQNTPDIVIPLPSGNVSSGNVSSGNVSSGNVSSGNFQDAERSLGVAAVGATVDPSLNRATIREYKAPQIVGRRVPAGWTVKTLPGYKFRTDAVFKLTDGNTYRVQGEPFVLVPINGRTSVNADTIRVLDSFIKVQDQLFAELEEKLIPGSSPEL
jgi:hypothetical protein